MPKPNTQIIINAIVQGIEKGKTRGQLLGTIGNKWEVSRTTFDRYWKTANEQHVIKQDKINKVLAIVDSTAAIDARKSGLKSKLDKQLNLQIEIEIIDKQLRGEVQFTFCVGNKINKSHNGNVFMLPVQIQNELRKTKLIFVNELNKMEGDYAPTKVAETNVAGKDKEYAITLNIS